MIETRWWWIRHAPVNSGGRLYGDSDPKADVSDQAAFADLAQRLPKRALWLLSHLQRTHQTAQALAAHLEPPLKGCDFRPGSAGEHLIDRRLGEQSFGDWHGKTYQEVEKDQGDEWHSFWMTPAHAVPPGGESFAHLMARVGEAITEINRDYRGRDIVCVAHGGTIRAALGLALGLPPERALNFTIDNVSLSRIDHFAGALGSHAPEEPESWRVSLVNFPPQSLRR